MTPASAEELARSLKSFATNSEPITVMGNNSKHLMAGPRRSDAVTLSTAGLRRIIGYQKEDLTISVEAGMSFGELQSFLAGYGQMIALDPPFSSQSTVGGVVACNLSGPMRRFFGTVRDLVIGMTFATLEGKLVKTGGMVVKNVAGLDMGKLMIGSFGSLGVITSVNFRVHSLPAETTTFLFTFSDLEAAISMRNEILKSVLQPIAIDLLTPAAAARLNFRGFVLAIRAAGSHAVLHRYGCELAGATEITGEPEKALWSSITEFAPEFLARNRSGVVLRASTPVTDLGALLRMVSGPCIARAGSGVAYIYLSSWHGVPALWNAVTEHGWTAVVEFAPDDIRINKELWIESASERRQNGFAMMKAVKQMFDPNNLLNASRLYGRI